MKFDIWADTQYVILIAFLRQQYLHEHALVLHFTYIACIVLFKWNGCYQIIRYMCGGAYHRCDQRVGREVFHLTALSVGKII
jgi:hypothetical protein